MFDDLRLTELHEEVATRTEAARREMSGSTRQFILRGDVRRMEGEIRRRVAVQVAHGPKGRLLYLGRLPPTDAEREYPRRRVPLGPPTPDEVAEMSAAEVALRQAALQVYPFDHWSNHADHEARFEGCHLCREGR